MDEINDRSATKCNCKVGTLIDEYDLADANADLVEYWTSGNEGIRAVADRFNRQLLREEMRTAEMELVEGRVENLYDLLTDDERLEAVRVEAQSSLAANGVDVDHLENRFLSHQTMYRHLRNCLGAEKGRPSLSIDKERTRIHTIQNRAEVVVDDTVSRLRDGGELDIDEFEILINFRVTCETCGSLHDITELLNAGGCDCHE